MHRDDFWNDQQRATKISQEKSQNQEIVNSFNRLSSLRDDTETALELAKEDSDFTAEAEGTLLKFIDELNSREFICKMSGPHDNSPALLEINGGSGGTEAQDWAEMLMRMYTRWAERKNFKVEVLDYSPGEEAGLKGVTISIVGPYAYGHLKAEQGVHRLVRISPFDANSKRHTSFAAVSVTPDIAEDIVVDINPDDLRIDTYRSSGAGGQHVNTTDSAVRITHIPTNTVVACQNERSQHKNKDRAMKMLNSKLFELLTEQQAEKLDELKGERKKIDYGSQIRSYVLHPYQMVKDLRTQFETSDTGGVLDGKIDGFIEAFLMNNKSSKNTTI